MNPFDNIFKIDSSSKHISGLTREMQSIYVYNRFIKNNESIVFLTSSLYEATQIYQSISNYTNEVLLFPMDDFITSEALAVSPELMITRLETLNELVNNTKKIVVTNLMGFLRYLPEKKLYKKNIMTLNVNEDYRLSDIANKIIDLGYEKEVVVDRTGQCAIRGFVIDLYPINAANPIRIEFFGDTIESIRYFDVNTQKTVERVDTITITPNTEFLSEKEAEEKLQKYLFKYTNVVNIMDYLENPLLILHNEENILNSYTFLKEEIAQYKNSVGVDDTQYMNNLNDYLKNYMSLNTGTSKQVDNINVSSSDLPFLPTKPDELNAALTSYLSLNKMMIIALSSRFFSNLYIQ